MKLLIFCIVIRTIAQVHCADSDPLSVIKEYYYKHEAAGDTEIPVVNKFEKSYDFIVIGGGSAGCVVANRLSEVPEWNVLLLEAGEQEDFLTDVPILLNLIPGTKRDWKYKTVKHKNNCLATHGSCNLPRGKVLGGSSVLNAFVYTRGDKLDFDEWEQLGNKGWSYKDVLGYFKKSEDLHIESLMNPEYRGTGGYLSVNYTGYETPLLKSFLEAAQYLGHNIVDYNDGNEAGFARAQFNSLHGRRDSAAKAFLRPIASRKNLSIATSAFVTKILIHPWKNVAYGVEFVKNGVTHQVMAKKEISLCAGAIGSPQILMLSGVGPWTDLLLTGIRPVMNLKVGYNLRDHIAIRDLKFFFDGDFTTINEDNIRSPNDVADYFQKGTGPLTVPMGFEGIGFLHTSSSENSETPDAELLLASLMLNFTKLTKDSPMKREAGGDKSFLMMGILVKPKSVGRLWLKSKDPEAHPAIDPNFLGDKSDVSRLVELAKMAVKVARTKAFAKYNTTLNPTPYPGCEDLVFESDEYWECAIRQVASTLHHQVGTCKMGPASDPDAVVDPRLRVYGIRGLRVVDASIMPTIPGAHTNAVVYMIAEKAADMVKEDLLPIGHPQRPRRHSKV